jgi:ribosomal protein S18 acetylase RimI-like enzyme
MSLSLRPPAPSDDPFLFQLYCSTRADEIATWGWDEAQRESFLRLQYTAQTGAYRAQFPGAEHRIVLRDDRPVGRILIHESESEFCLVDIALLPEHRGTGIGAALIRELLARADAAEKPVVLSVTRENPAAALYGRLGFITVADDGVYLRLRREPS